MFKQYIIYMYQCFIRIDVMLSVLSCFIQQYPYTKKIVFRKLRYFFHLLHFYQMAANGSKFIQMGLVL